MRKKKVHPIRLGYLERNFFKNHQIFMEKLYKDERFFGEILEWYLKLRLTKKMLGDPFTIGSFKNHKAAHEYGLKLMRRISEEKNIEFIEWFNNFFSRYSLSRNWEIPITNYIACGYYCPPENVNIRIQKNNKEVVLYLDPPTSLNDIRNSWPLISEALDNKHKKRRISKSFYANIEEQIKAVQISRETCYDVDKCDDVKADQLRTLYEIYHENDDKLNEIDENQKHALGKFRTNKHRFKRYINWST